MTYLPLAAILALLFTGAAVTLTVLFRSIRAGHFSNLQSGAYVIFDDDEPVGTPQDQLFRASHSASHDASDTDGSASSGQAADPDPA
ncbi:hypothetical protein CRI93_10385 [Longimonas halophila]|uniref:Cbb3-type cytochrome oxidase assembly protein CcoS n=1 Tax=Longimonas halophila TaxID=1469170 RepID=A0A2H3NK57_9BACT|nr:hypothetical protein [Longimonas halophila]PEN06225.1 hypothetical protein CRI93_10385 [Longimonas halophila]